MKALVHDPTATAGLRHADVPDPVPGPGQVLMEVRATSLNFLDAAYRDERLAVGAVPGVDAAGVVVAPAGDGSGPAAGARVVAFGQGAWAQRLAVDTADVAVLPDGVDLAVAAALPGAGVTALRAVRRLGSVLGRRVLVTGASGGVGRYAVQLAALAGSDVVAAVGSRERGAGLAGLGARDVVVGLDEVAGSVHSVLDTVGGPLLAEAFALLAESGLALSIGQASRRPTTIDFEQERRRSGGRRLEPFVIGSGVGVDLQVLLDLVRRGRLDPQIGWRGSWLDAADAARALLDREVPGKAVLEVA
ncbi:zinc-binding dehydrogenase [Pseudonocardia sp. CA-142604]|uniref:zinc-binding dehydrogenase n=1 Tax=Pseudonocardia sp. CA-142604 TaxID=3240024 RepID=UPI003D94B7B7